MKTHTDITLVLDESSSMRGLRDATISGFNEFIQQQETLPGTAEVTLWTFNDKAAKVFTSPLLPAGSIRLSNSSYYPEGMTALLDAVAMAIDDAGERLSRRPTGDPANVIFVIITDGEENSSRSFTRDQVKAMIEHQREKYSWKFLFFGANIDAVKAGGSIGISKDQASQYMATADGTLAAYRQFSRSVTSMRAGK